ncbi:hypothetical protein LWI28_001771 [Acer negundo]|uniref:Uncharacterized protein n=1 Tax=Acer negundo TaxID=4023 RepID=A0AAD5JEM8_ACENE|nr:hypothetical protein LWI28_001771 [Acer negundo]
MEIRPSAIEENPQADNQVQSISQNAQVTPKKNGTKSWRRLARGGEKIKLRVASLIDRLRRGWNSEKLNQLLIPMDRVAIWAIPVSWSAGQDKLQWHYEKKGKYSVNSRYHVGLMEKSTHSSFTSSAMKRWWNFIWSKSFTRSLQRSDFSIGVPFSMISPQWLTSRKGRS